MDLGQCHVGADLIGVERDGLFEVGDGVIEPAALNTHETPIDEQCVPKPSFGVTAQRLAVIGLGVSEVERGVGWI